MLTTPPEKSLINLDGAPTVKRAGPGAIDDSNSDVFFAAVETTRMPMVVTDPRQPDNPIIFANRAFTRMTGYPRAEIVGSNCRFLQGLETDPATVTAVRDAIREGREIAVEILNYRKDGSAFWNALFIAPVRSAEGEVVYFFASQLDVSHRRDIEDMLRQAQKMEALGQLTGSIAHDFNNLLQVMTGYLDILEIHAHADAVEPQKVFRGIVSIRSAVQKAAALTQQLLSFARKQQPEGRTVNLNLLTENLTDLLCSQIGANVELQTDLAPDLWNCEVDPTQMEVALLNVLLNARDAMDKGGLLTLTTANAVIGAEQGQTLAGIEEGRYVTITITDTGAGMSPDLLERVMDPFFTTKAQGKGTGLGLSMVHGFAKRSGGSVQILSELGHGTTVRIYFPATDAKVRASPRTGQPAGDSKGTETILVVDDRWEVAELAQAMLESFGYTVLVRTDVRDALDILDAPRRIDMLFTDVVMPGGMNGFMLAREARKRRPGIKILLTTGYADATMESNTLADCEFDVIGKPYRRAELSQTTRRVLDAPIAPPAALS